MKQGIQIKFILYDFNKIYNNLFVKKKLFNTYQIII